MILQRGAILEALAANSAPKIARKNFVFINTKNKTKQSKERRKMQMRLTESHSSTEYSNTLNL
jgi:hypothetical protein